MVSQYLSELDKKYRSNPYSTLKDLQAEHICLRSLLKEMEVKFEAKIKIHLETQLPPTPQPTKKLPSKKAPVPAQPPSGEKYKKWLQLYKKITQLRALVAHVNSTVVSKEQMLQILSDKPSPNGVTNSENTESVLQSALDQTSEALTRLKREYSANRELLDSRNQTLLSYGSADSLVKTLQALKVSVQMEEDKYTRVLQQCEQLASQLAINKADIDKLMQLDEEKLKQALDPKSQQLELQYWSMMSKRTSLDQYVRNLQHQLTE